MYEKLTDASGIEAVGKYLNQFRVESGPDGLELVTQGQGGLWDEVALPDRLRDWLVDIRLLRNIPLAYLVPDAALLPPESIRFFHVDPTWVDRVVDGIFAAANTGTVDFVFSYSLMRLVRDAIDGDLGARAQAQFPHVPINWTGAKPMTGMLIRSELVRRWPDLIVRAYSQVAVADPDADTDRVPILRSEAISKDVHLALFAGQPSMVHIREPNVGTRYGVEPDPNGFYKVDGRDDDGSDTNQGGIAITYRDAGRRIINLTALAGGSVEKTPRQVALNLEQLPYVQEFKDIHLEQRGSRTPEELAPADGSNQLTFRKGRTLNLRAFVTRLQQQQAMEEN